MDVALASEATALLLVPPLFSEIFEDGHRSPTAHTNKPSRWRGDCDCIFIIRQKRAKQL